MKKNHVYQGDAAKLLASKRIFKSESVNLIVTSPPYSNRRKHTYGGIDPDEYVEWFLGISEKMHSILTPDGSLIINIKEGASNGEKETYVIELILAMKKQGWYWIEEYIWHKKNAFPGKWPNRFRDSWERCLHFTKNKKFAMYQDNVMVPIGEWSKSRIKSMLSEKANSEDFIRRESSTNNKSARNVSNWIKRELVYPSNVLYLSGETSNKGHSAVYPLALPEWFINLFSKEGDIVLDPFIGSGTTAIAAIKNNRNYIGIEILPENVALANKRISEEA